MEEPGLPKAVAVGADERASSHCLNDGTYTCNCVPGYTGLRCETRVCQPEWHEWQGKCYKYVTIPKSWSDAEMFCSSHYGANLVSIHSSVEGSFVRELSTDPKDVWIGLSDTVTEGTFVWSDGSEKDYTNWMGGEPNAYGNEDCVHFWSVSDRWNDQACSYEKKFVCKK
ncbi:C-type lectin BfL-2-like [Amphiura filiformis]|uniref:C-type lectin BfL-2-like n=1 Tax=Amphiura filiformis TaxID=82378 RepID=UPI003B211534